MRLLGETPYIKAVTTGVLHHVICEVNNVHSSHFPKGDLYHFNITIFGSFAHITRLPVEVLPAFFMIELPVGIRKCGFRVTEYHTSHSWVEFWPLHIVYKVKNKSLASSFNFNLRLAIFESLLDLEISFGVVWDYHAVVFLPTPLIIRICLHIPHSFN